MRMSTAAQVVDCDAQLGGGEVSSSDECLIVLYRTAYYLSTLIKLAFSAALQAFPPT